MKLIATVLLFNSMLVASALGGEFEPRIERLVPLVDKAGDLDLLSAGSPAARMKRARPLLEAAAAFRLDSGESIGAFVNWLAAVAVAESALRDAKDVPAGDAELLLQAYGHLMDMRREFVRFAKISGGWSPFQRAGAAGFARQLLKVPAYSADAIAWLGKRMLANDGRALSEGSYATMAKAARFRGDFGFLLSVADRACESRPGLRCRAWKAEALFGLGRGEDAENILPEAGDDGAFRIARARGTLRRLLKGAPDAGALKKALRVLAELGEQHRAKSLVPRERVIALADPELDELYLGALFADGIQYEDAWTFASRAAGRPRTPGFLTRRVSAGLMKLMDCFTGKKAEYDFALSSALVGDLRALSGSLPQLASRMSLHLEVLDMLASPVAERPHRLREFERDVHRYLARYPADTDGLKIMLLGRLIGSRIDVSAHLRRVRETHADIMAGISGIAGAVAVRAALKEKDLSLVRMLDAWLEDIGCCRLWRAHMLAVEGLLGPEKMRQKLLQRALKEYTGFISSLNEGPVANDSLVDFCDTVGSIATLMMQSQQLEQARQLVRQVSQACSQVGEVEATASVLEMAGSAKSGQVADSLARLAKAVDLIGSSQAKLQAMLWLGVALEAAGEKKAASEMAATARGFAEQMARDGIGPFFFPDPRALVATG
ncbi:MAG: hypothetical protein D6806_17730, partial [Deltaproteobacteria bacterium]